MKNPTGLLVLASLLAGSLLSGCNKTAKNDVTEAVENMAAANTDLKDAVIADKDEVKTKTIADWNKFKTESDSTIAGLEKEGKDIRQKITKENNREKAKLNSDLTKEEQRLTVQKEKLKKRNVEFQADLKSFDESVVKKQDSFKREFKHDMDEIGTAFKDLFKDNVK